MVTVTEVKLARADYEKPQWVTVNMLLQPHLSEASEGSHHKQRTFSSIPYPAKKCKGNFRLHNKAGRSIIFNGYLITIG